MAPSDRCDVFVVGGGPAGATAARLLASWGWSVIVAHRIAPARMGLAESLPASTRKLLAFLDLLHAVESAAFHPNTGNAGSWAGTPRETPTADAGFHVRRPVFDALLRDESSAAGARIINGIVRRVELGAPHRVEYASDGTTATCTASIVLDCSGRAGVVARQGFRRAGARYRTLAVAADWNCPAWPAVDRTRTVIESYRDGWAWSVPVSAHQRQCTVMVDPAALGVRQQSADRFALQRAYVRELGRSGGIMSRLAGATQASPPWACEASVYDAARAADRGVLLVGDAASFIEPLSSAGVKKAMTSAWRAAVVANTCLANAGMSNAAVEFYSDRERAVYADCQHRAGQFFQDADACHASGFWSSRAQATARAAATTERRAGAVRDAFDRLRAAPRLDLRLASSLRFTSIADIEGRQVVLREAVVMPDDEEPMRFAAGVNLAALARLAVACDEVPTLFSAYTARVGPVPMDGLLTGLSLLVARQALIHEDARS